MYTNACMYIYIYIYIYVYIYVCVHIYIYIYIYLHVSLFVTLRQPIKHIPDTYTHMLVSLEMSLLHSTKQCYVAGNYTHTHFHMCISINTCTHTHKHSLPDSFMQPNGAISLEIMPSFITVLQGLYMCIYIVLMCYACDYVCAYA